MMDLIYNQRNIPKDQWRYGFRSSAATGCGWIATYNALSLLGYRAEPESLIAYYEKQLPLIHGNIGTTFWAPVLCFRKWGFPVNFSVNSQEFDHIAKNSDVSILFYHWRNGLRFGAHFVAIQHTDQGFIGYNTYRNSVGPDPYGESLKDFLRRKKYFGSVLIGIQDKRNKRTPA